eukprot:TRINITY_DN47833_c0_g3_i2.p1 TRINITY_DN47833_c0_g3~~TRINITY_DN47833_c0_g3_i2.p1  ORF type:complete len:283 (+),score=44.68 TRINITY_DN47833_c0_g3_i2:85-933(+)
MIFQLLILVVLTIYVDAQNTEWICSDVEPTLEVFTSVWNRDINETVVDEFMETAGQIYDSYFKGLGIEDAAQNLPKAFNQTWFVLSALRWPLFDFRAQAAATVQGIFQSENGTEVLFQAIDKPEIFAETLSVGISNLNLSCWGDQSVGVVALALALTQPLISQQYQDILADFLVGLTVHLGETYGAGSQIVSVLEPIISTLETTGDATGVFSSLLDLASSDNVANAFEVAISSQGIETDASTWAGIMSLLFQQLQKVLDLDEEQFVTFQHAKKKKKIGKAPL